MTPEGGRLTGKVALVTGGANGIGRGCAEALAEEGSAVVVTDIDAGRGEACVAAIGARGGVAFYISHDVTVEAAWVDVLAAVECQFGRLDVLVNNAGIAISRAITDMSLEAFRRQQAVNVEGVFLGLKHALPMMRSGGGGSIINMSSIAGLNGVANLAAYSATKAAVRLLSKSAALECATLKDGVRVNSVLPGIIETGIRAAAGDIDLDSIAAVATPLGRKGLPHDIAQGVVFLASEEARYITGTELVIDGGMSAG